MYLTYLHFSVTIKFVMLRISLAVLWLGLHAFTAECLSSILNWRTKIPQATQHGKKKKEKIRTIIPNP